MERKPGLLIAFAAMILATGGCASPDLQTAAPVGAESLGYAPTSYEAHVEALKRVTVDGRELAYLDLGEGPVVLLVHGVPTSSWAYRKVAADLVAKGFRVIAPDLLGYGASEMANDGEELDPERQGARILGLMETLEVEGWIQVVHDAGGPWSFTMLPHAGERVRGLVLTTHVHGHAPASRFLHGLVQGTGRTRGLAIGNHEQHCSGALLDTLQSELEALLARAPKVSGAGAQARMSEGLSRVLERAFEEASQLKDEYVSTEHLLLGIAADTNDTAGAALASAGATPEAILQALASVRGSARVTDPDPESKYQALSQFGRDLPEVAGHVVQ